MFFFILKILLSIAIIIILQKFLISPYIIYRRFRNYGFKDGIFYPVIGIVKKIVQSFKQDRDAFHFFKLLPMKDASIKGYLYNWGSNVYLTLFAPDFCREFLVNKYSHYQKDPFFFHPITKLTGSRNILFSDGADWKLRRKVLSKCFHYEVLKSNIPTMIDVASEVLARNIDKDLLQRSNFNSMNEFQEITGRIFISSFCGKEFSQFVFEGEALPVSLANMLGILGNQSFELLYLLFGPKIYDLGLLKSHRELNSKILRLREEMKKLLVKKREQFEKNKITAGLKNEQNEKVDLIMTVFESIIENSDYSVVTDEDILNEVITLFLAGTDTTGHLVTSVTYALCEHPEVYTKLIKEIDENLKKKSELIWDNLQKMNYLSAVIKETLRFYPNVVSIFPRIAIEKHKLGDLEVRKGDRITTNFCPNFHNPKYFTDPLKYDPDRWLSESNNIETLNPFAFTPFSSGPRNCIGQNMAQIEAKVIMIYFLKKFSFSPKKDYKMAWTVNFLVEPAQPFLLDLKVKQDFALWNAS